MEGDEIINYSDFIKERKIHYYENATNRQMAENLDREFINNNKLSHNSRSVAYNDKDEFLCENVTNNMLVVNIGKHGHVYYDYIVESTIDNIKVEIQIGNQKININDISEFIIDLLYNTEIQPQYIITFDTIPKSTDKITIHYKNCYLETQDRALLWKPNRKVLTKGIVYKNGVCEFVLQ